MKSVLVPLYWIWCGVSVFVLVRRRVRRTGETPPVTDQADATPFAATPHAGSVAAIPAPTSSTEPPTISPDHPSVAAARFEAAPAPPASIAPPSEQARALSLGVPLSTVESLADALAGITLPCDLVPLTASTDFDPKLLVLIATDHPADVVGTAVADEIESLGFGLTPLDEQRLMALSDDSSVEITIHPDPTVADEFGNRRFPTASPDAVVVELRLR